MKADDRWEVVKTIFGQAIELEGKRREQYLREACAGDVELLAEVQSLLDADSPETVIVSPLKVASPPKRNWKWCMAMGPVVVVLVVGLALRPSADIAWSLEGDAVHVRASQAGYVYVLADDQAQDILTVLATAPVTSGVEAKIPVEASGDLYGVWSSEKVAELERSAGKVVDYEDRVRLRQFLDHAPEPARVRPLRPMSRR